MICKGKKKARDISGLLPAPAFEAAVDGGRQQRAAGKTQ